MAHVSGLGSPRSLGMSGMGAAPASVQRDVSFGEDAEPQLLGYCQVRDSQIL